MRVKQEAFVTMQATVFFTFLKAINKIFMKTIKETIIEI